MEARMSRARDRVTFGNVLRVPEFRAIWIAGAQSMAGDQLARVALSVLVFERTSSPALTALVYALTFLPAILGGALLSGLADRLPRRSLMIWCDLFRAAAAALMALPATPLWAVCVLVVLSTLVGRPFSSAQMAMTPEILGGDAYVVGTGLQMMTAQLAQLAGFAGGGVAIAAIGARGGLALDAVTFALSALIVRLAVKNRPVPISQGNGEAAPVSVLGSAAQAAKLLVTDPRLRALVGMGWLAAFHIVPEGLAAPYADSIGGGPTAVGLLMAAAPAGSALGVFLIVRLPEARRAHWIGALAIATGLPLIACVAKPSLGVSIALWAVSGLFSGYQVQAAASFVRATPNRLRGQTIGLATSGLLAIQGVGILVFGLVASQVGASSSIAIAGLIATVLAIPLAASWAHILRTSVISADVGVAPSGLGPSQASDYTESAASGRHRA